MILFGEAEPTEPKDYFFVFVLFSIKYTSKKTSQRYHILFHLSFTQWASWFFQFFKNQSCKINLFFRAYTSDSYALTLLPKSYISYVIT